MTFSDLGLGPALLEAIGRLDFETPTPVQAEVIPVLLESDRDLVALAQTGTGKTAAFGLPVLERLDPETPVPQALVLCPTRELCMQIARDLRSFAACLPAVRVLPVYGGADIRPQLSALSRGVHVVVATPGRMLDVLRRGAVDLSRIARVVLDEADEMLNMGFEEDLEAILAQIPGPSQTLLFSATMPAEVAKIARKYMDSPAEITLGTRNAGAASVRHEYCVVQAKHRYDALRRIVDVHPDMYGIVFCRTRLETQEIADRLRADGYNAEPLHGDLSQAQRDQVMRKFRDRYLQLLVATDVAARGLDVNDLSHVINYNLPDELTSYTHRTGRTGRAGKEGTAVSIVHLREQFRIKQLERVVGQTFERCPVPTGALISRARVRSLARQVLDGGEVEGLEPHREALAELFADLSKEEVVERFVHFALRDVLAFYRTAPDLNVAERETRQRRPSTGGGRPRESGMVDMVMNVGSLNGLTPKMLMGLVNSVDRNRRVTIGRINIVRKQAYFQVPEAHSRSLIESFAASAPKVGGRRVRVAQAGRDNRERKPYAGKGHKGAARRQGRSKDPAG